jgi:hypothetical protein
MDASLIREGLLAQAFREAQAAQVLTEANADIHVALRARLSPIDLQTIRDILVD